MIFLLITTNFVSSQDGKERGFVTFAERALKRFGAKQFGPWPEIRAGGGLTGRIPARSDSSSEGEVGENSEGACARL